MKKRIFYPVYVSVWLPFVLSAGLELGLDPEETECPCELPITFPKESQEGSFKSPNSAPCSYSQEHGQTVPLAWKPCMWIIEEGLENQGIRLYFENFDLHNVMYLDLKFVPNGSTQVLFFKRIDGILEAPEMPEFVIGAGGTLIIHLIHRSDINIGSFTARWRRFNVEADSCVLSPFFLQISDQDTPIKSPVSSKNFCHSVETYQIIRALDPEKSVEATLNITLGMGEMLMLFDKHPDPPDAMVHFDSHLVLQAIRSSVFVGPTGGPSLPAFKRRSSVNQMLIIFRTVETTKQYKSDMENIHISVKQVDSPCACPLSYNGDPLIYSGKQGNLSSPGSPRYCHNMNCSYHMKVEEGNIVLITFDHLDLRSDDIIHLYRGNDTTPAFSWKSIRKSRFSVAVDSSEATLRYISGAPDTGFLFQSPGFSLNYTALQRSLDCSCPAHNPMVLSSPSGRISHNACGRLDCLYYIKHPTPGTSNFNLLKITIHHLKIRDKLDALLFARIKNNMWDQDARSLRLFRGDSLKNMTFYIDIHEKTGSGFYITKLVPDWDTVVVHFIMSDALTIPDAGFDLSYEWIYHNCSCGESEFTATAVRDAGSQGPTQMSNHFFTPPWSPKPYCNNLYCSWTIKAQNPDHFISMSVLHLDMENGPDKLIIRDKNVNENQIVLTGNRHVKSDIKSNSSELSIIFRSDDSLTGSGWTIMFHSECCISNPNPSHTTASTKHFHSSNISLSFGTTTARSTALISTDTSMLSQAVLKSDLSGTPWKDLDIHAEIKDLRRSEKSAWGFVAGLAVVCSLLIIILVGLSVVLLWMRKRQGLAEDQKVIYFSNRAYEVSGDNSMECTDI